MENLPFSRRFPGENDKITFIDDFPESDRKGLIHIFQDCIDRHNIDNWNVLAGEILRISRLLPRDFLIEDNGNELAKNKFIEILYNLKWQQVFDLCERVYNKFLHGWFDEETCRSPLIDPGRNRVKNG